MPLENEQRIEVLEIQIQRISDRPRPATIALIWAITRCLKGIILALEKYAKGEIIKST